MVEINLLPWRALRRRQWWQGLLVVSLILIIVIFFCLRLLWTRPQTLPAPIILPKPVISANVLRGLQYIGFIQQGERACAIIRLADGSIQMVMTGEKIVSLPANVWRINAQVLQIRTSDQRLHRFTLRNSF
jgi:hypothetical protein